MVSLLLAGLSCFLNGQRQGFTGADTGILSRFGNQVFSAIVGSNASQLQAFFDDRTNGAVLPGCSFFQCPVNFVVQADSEAAHIDVTLS